MYVLETKAQNESGEASTMVSELLSMASAVIVNGVSFSEVRNIDITCHDHEDYDVIFLNLKNGDYASIAFEPEKQKAIFKISYAATNILKISIDDK